MQEASSYNSTFCNSLGTLISGSLYFDGEKEDPFFYL